MISYILIIQFAIFINKVISISDRANIDIKIALNTLGKGMNPIILPPAMGK